MNTVALVLAAGEAMRMNGELKQLLPIGDRTILGRILYQLHLRQTRSIIVTHKKEIVDYHYPCYASAGGTTEPENHDTVCDTLLSAAHIWYDRTIVLLGDVVYSNMIMNEIVRCHEPIRVFGNTWEIFAVVFNKEKHSEVKTALRKGSEYKRGKLRYFYHAYCGFELGCQETEAKPLEDEVFYYVGDWTRDIDTPYHYERLMTEVVDTGLHKRL
ncbi:MAG: NTP transferase domain-containing protein [Planctomycetota bacterium]|jgi:choline kinase